MAAPRLAEERIVARETMDASAVTEAPEVFAQTMRELGLQGTDSGSLPLVATGKGFVALYSALGLGTVPSSSLSALADERVFH